MVIVLSFGGGCDGGDGNRDSHREHCYGKRKYILEEGYGYGEDDREFGKGFCWSQ